MLSVAAFVVTSAMVLGQTATNETPLNEFGNAFAGRWLADVELASDWPGLGSAGDTVVGFIAARRVAGDSAVQFEWTVGESHALCFHVWDAASKKIRFMSSDSLGTIYHGTTLKKGNAFAWELQGSYRDGTLWSGTGTWTIADDGDTITLDGDFTTGGKKDEHVRNVYRRITK